MTGEGETGSGMHFDPTAIISEANSLYRAVRRSNRILDNAIIRSGVQAWCSRFNYRESRRYAIVCLKPGPKPHSPLYHGPKSLSGLSAIAVGGSSS